MALKEISNPPNALRFILGIREIGYDINQAVAELIDNSITYGSKNIKIDFFRLANTQNFVFRIADDGKGMDKPGIFNAMKFGSDCSDILDDLGKYGMGLKIASFSQCRKFSTISIKKSEKDRKKFVGYYWDIDHVEKVKDWKMVELDYKDIIKNKFLKESVKNFNTIILWEKIDKIDEILENAQRPERIVGTITGRLEKFIRMTYHRYLDGSLGKNKTIRIILNDIYLKPWDPFCINEEQTDTRDKISFELQELPTSSDILIEPYILPTKEGKYKFSTPEKWKDAKGLLSWNDSQGIYIYRENRLIQCGGWLGTREKDEHTKYARIAISFKKEHDDPFRIALNKTKTTLPHSLFEFLRDDKQIKKVLGDAKARGGSELEKTLLDPPITNITKSGLSEDTPKIKTSENIPPNTETTNITISDHSEDIPKIKTSEKTNGRTWIIEEPIYREDNGKIHLKNPKIVCDIEFKGENDYLWSYRISPNDEITISINREHIFFESFRENNQQNEKILSLLTKLICAITQTEIKFHDGFSEKSFNEKIKSISNNLLKIIGDDKVVS